MLSQLRRWYLLLNCITLTCAIFVLTTEGVSAAVAVSSFTAQAQVGQIILNWATASEINNAGFNLLRSDSANGAYARINSHLIPGCGGCIAGNKYTFTDNTAMPDQTYFYQLQTVDIHGAAELFGPIPANAITATPTATSPATPTYTPATPLPTPTRLPNTATPTNIIASPNAATQPTLFPPHTTSPAPANNTRAPNPNFAAPSTANTVTTSPTIIATTFAASQTSTVIIRVFHTQTRIPPTTNSTLGLSETQASTFVALAVLGIGSIGFVMCTSIVILAIWFIRRAH